MTPLLAGIDSLIGLLIFVVISVVASWLKKKQQTKEHENAPAPPPLPAHRTGVPPAAEPAKQVSWEEELRRLLQGEQPAAPVPPPLPPVVHETRRPAPWAVPEPEPEPVHRHRSVFDVIEERSPVDVDVQPNFQPLHTLTESAQAYQQASLLDRTVTAHLRDVTQRPVGTTSVQRKGNTPEASAALAMMRNRHSLRSALLASVILGPPKALAN